MLSRLERIAVFGLGLIGGSTLRAARAAGRQVWGYDPDPAARLAASADGYDVHADAATAVAGADLLILAMPLPQVASALDAVADALSADTVVTDVGTLKRPVRAAIHRALPGHRFVGGHPLAGTEESGWRAGDAALFHAAPWSLTLDETAAGGPTELSPHQRDTPLDDWLSVAEFVCELGAHPVPTTDAEQDDAVARVIGLPHVLAEMLAVTGLEGGPLGLSLAAGSYTTGSRVARTRPELVATWCDGNPALVAALDEVIGLLGQTRDALGRGESVQPMAERGHAARMNWETRRARPVSVPRERHALLAHGRAGGWLTAVPETGDLHGMLPT